MAFHDGIESLTIGRCHVLHIREIFQSTFYFKRCCASLCQILQIIDTVHIFQRQQITITNNLPTLRILKRELHATELRTLTAIGTATETILRGITKSRITDTQRTMYKDLEFNVRHLIMDFCDFIKGEFASQHHAGKAQASQPPYFLHCTVVSLCGSVRRHGQILHHLEYSHILNQDSINSRLCQLG